MIEYRDVPSAPGYVAGSDGQVWRFGRPLKGRCNGHGYLRLKISIRNIQRDAYVHRLVCEAFHGSPAPGMAVRHLDGSRDNNVPSNLVWATKAENEADKLRHGTLNWGERNGQRILTKDQVLEARRRVLAGESRRMVALDFGVSRAAIGDAVAGRRWARLPGALTDKPRRLTPSEVQDIRAEVAKGTRKVDLARKHKITWGSVQRIVIGTRHGRDMQAGETR